jgi:short-subunit dehydrogenase
MKSKNIRIALICGTSGGLGSFLAKKFLNNNYQVLAINRKKTNFKYSNYKEYYCDFENHNLLKKVIIKIKNKFKKINIFINAVAVPGSISYSYNKNINICKKTFDINFFSNVVLMPHLIDMLKKDNNKKSSGGSIFFFSGGGATIYPYGIRKNLTEYSCSKIALIKYAECLSAEDIIKNNVNINVIAPGLLPTKITREILLRGKKFIGKEKTALNKALNLKSNANFEKIYNLISYLQKNKKITGKIFSSIYDDLDIIKKFAFSLDSFSLRRTSQ